jgi:predicted transcriptional regulator
LGLKLLDPKATALAGGKVYDEKKHLPYSIFIADTAFYDEITKKLNRNRNYVQRLLAELARIGAIRLIRRMGNVPVYADGYFFPVPVKDKRTGENKTIPRKMSFLTEKLKIGLRSFQLWKKMMS